MPSLLAIADLHVEYRGRQGWLRAVRGVSLALAPGERLGLVGESGSGKSSVALAALRHLGPEGRMRGRIQFRGAELPQSGTAALQRIRGGGIGMVYQEAGAALNPRLRIDSQLVEVAMLHGGLGRGAAREAAGLLLRRLHLGDPERVLRAYPHQLSGGQQQRVVIAMALLPRPAVLLLDEPTSGLDATVAAATLALVDGLIRESGTAALLISHDLALTRRFADRVAVMYAGEVVEEGPAGAVLAEPHHPYTRALLQSVADPTTPRRCCPRPSIPGEPPAPGSELPGCRFQPRCGMAVAGLCDLGAVALEAAGGARIVRCRRWREPAADVAAAAGALPAPAAKGAPVIAVRDLHKRYPLPRRSFAELLGWRAPADLVAADGITLAVRAGETVALVGESGSGKTTVARILLGLTPATEGAVEIAGHEVSRVPAARRPVALRRAVQIVFQNPETTLNPALRVRTQLRRAVRRLGVVRGEPAEAALRRLLALVRLGPEVLDRWPWQLSGGQKQRVAIARACAGAPAAVVADEPVSALDVSVQAAIIAMLDGVQRTHGTALLLISHDLGVVRALADRVVVLYRGRVMEEGPAEAVFAPPHHPYTAALLAAASSAREAGAARPVLLDAGPVAMPGPTPGCPFADRCPAKLGPVCERVLPPARVISGGHVVRCHLPLVMEPPGV